MIAKALNDKLFGGGNSVGKTLRMDGNDFRIVGVLDDWRPTPKFYDLNCEPLRRSRAGVPAVLHLARPRSSAATAT